MFTIYFQMSLGKKCVCRERGRRRQRERDGEGDPHAQGPMYQKRWESVSDSC